MYKMRDSLMQQQYYNNNNYYLPPPHSSHHRQHRTARRAAAAVVAAAPQLPPPQRVPSPNCCSSSAATSSTVSEPITLDLATNHYFVKEKENWREEPNRCRPRRFPFRHFLRSSAPIPDNFVNGARMAKFDGHARRYSTSDLTTSDSELGRFGAGNAKPYRLGIKCPSVSTINPDDSSDLDQMLYQPRVVQLPKKLASSRRFRHKRTDFFAAAVDLDDCAKSDAELTERPPSHRHGRQHARRMNNNNNNADDDAWSPPPPPPSRGGTQSAPRTPQRRAMPPALEMIEEISPVLPRPADVRDDLDIPPLPRPLQLSKEWRPLQTSTLTNFHATLPKTNPRYATKLPPIAPLEPPRSLFDPQYTAMCCGVSSTDEFNKPVVRPEQFNLPSVMAKAKGIRGILFLQLCVTGDSVLKVQVRNGAYFLKSLPISSFVKVEIRRSISSRRRDKYAAAHQQQKRRFCSRVTYPVSQNNQPEFYEEFTFRISRTHLEHGDKLGISVFVQHSGEEKTPELLGGMSFSLVKMIKMAHLHTTSSQQRFFHYDDHQSHLPMGDVSVKLYEGGFFLLPDKKALTTKFAQDKISIRKYYDDIGGCSTTMSTTTSSMGSPFRMMSEPEWSSAARFGLGTVPPNYATVQHHHRHHHHQQQLCTSSATGTKSHAKQLPPSQPPSSLTVLAAPAAVPSCAAGGGSAESGADTSHYTTSNSSSSGAHSAVDCKRTRAAAPAADLLLTSGVPPAVPPPSVNTTDTTTSDFTSSGFTSSVGGEMVEQTAVATLANSFSSGCAEVGGGTADGSCSSDESASSSPAVVVELATNFNDHDDGQQQPRKSSLQHHYFSPMRMHRGGGCSSQKSVPPAPPPTSSCELIDQYQQQQQQSPKRSTKAAPSADGRAGRLRTALAATDTVRRVASFTFSPPGTLRSGSVQHNQHHLLTTDNKQQHGMRLDKRNSVSTAGGGGGGGTDKLQRKTALGPLSKTLHFLRSKLDFSMSASTLCPSREDCRLWQESFEALLAHKYGCLLFREFLQSEFSEENLEFWLECEEFKRMKTGKKSTALKANQIFDNFVRELAPKEVNLDSQTRLATQAALAVVPLRTEMFTMAQHKIEQLMAKDSYPRFLKSEQYLELLNNNNNDNNAGGEQQQHHHYKGLLRVASAREGSAKSLSGSGGGGGCSRSPSLSPKLRSVSPRGTRWSARRNTCAPTTTTTSAGGDNGAGGGGIGTALTLQIPSIAE